MESGAWRFELSGGIYRSETAGRNRIQSKTKAEDGVRLLPEGWQWLGTVSCTGSHICAAISHVHFTAVVRGIRVTTVRLVAGIMIVFREIDFVQSVVV